MYKNIQDIFDQHMKKVKFDRKLYKKLRSFRLGWSQKEDFYMDFLGSNLVGVHPIRFSTRDVDMLFSDVFQIDKNDISEAIIVLDQKIQKEDGFSMLDRKVASDTTYLTLVYSMRRFLLSDEIGRYREEAMKELYYIFAYKVTGSLSSRYFKFNLDEATAKAVYEKLSKKYLIKKLGSWSALYEYRSKNILPPDGLHVERLKRFNNIDAMTIAADLQGRIRELFKGFYEVLKDVMENDDVAKSTSLIEESEEGDKVGSVTSSGDSYIQYLKDVVNIENDFVINDLIYLITQLVPKTDEKNLKTVLKFISNNLNTKKDNNIDFISIVVIKTVGYLRTKNITHDYNKRIPEILKLMKGYWSSSSVKDEDVIKVKKFLFEVSREATGKRTKWLLSSLTISILLYVFVRALYRKK